MQRFLSRPLALMMMAAALVAPLAGCATSKNKADTKYVARDVNVLYAAARYRLNKGQYKLAAQIFDEVERQHPYSPWARRAQLMSAFSYYLARQYPESIQSAQRFISIHPGNKDASYALYLIGVDYFEQIEDVTRDQKITQQALDAMGELIRRYPDSAYAADARIKVDLIRDHLAGKEMEIGRWYQARHEYLAAVIRFRTVVEKYDTTSHVPEALHRLVETYLELGLRDEARETAAVLGFNYPGSKWYQRSYALINKAHLAAR